MTQSILGRLRLEYSIPNVQTKLKLIKTDEQNE